MTKSLILVGIAGVLVTIVMVIWRRVREDSRVGRFASKYNLKALDRGRSRMRRELQEAALAQIGHSRRFRYIYEAPNGVRVASYVFETGTESNRAMHSWRVAVIDVEHLARYAILTCEPVLLASGRLRRLTPIEGLSARDDDTPRSPHDFLTDDDEYWTGILSNELRQFFTQQSRDRTWELLPGRLVAYEAGAFTENEVVAIADQMARCAHLLEDASDSLAAESLSVVAAG